MSIPQVLAMRVAKLSKSVKPPTFCTRERFWCLLIHSLAHTVYRRGMEYSHYLPSSSLGKWLQDEDAQSLPKGWKELFVNANDQSNKCIYSPQHPYFSVQFHPESAPGPQDTKFLFDIFLQSIIACSQDGSFLPVIMPGGNHFENSLKTPRVLVKKVLVLGSGGLSIGQAHSNKTGNLAEIDYSIAEALAFRTILEEGYDIRLSGQDRRTIVPLNQLSAKNSQPGNLEIVNSPLSKYAVLGFELGLSYLTSRLCLTFWEVQFGDFVNTAQVAVESSIDQ
ncbi:hypothetical protein PPACK8108_LOCUS24784 [Phakopsora pachyrhizi]|uniref:Glutamine amidotransferase domain-containing protein n=1 Tax=Phakopsora pachyrhizi TaxID=170000 RepID=A0AAV0BTM5_PHAPC|nr:hypothetical protein PPACK8108_LOCUS24784 [Phakopsora pachyrhizi]